MRTRGEVFEPGKEEPGGVGVVAVIGREGRGSSEGRGPSMPLRGPTFFKKIDTSTYLCIQSFTFTF